ncbi:TIGR02679 domain-containing protein [Fonticella tunisiensis]|uniref:Uncharacterized protein (TIGR02679 family) n=1 Tax=Fonticella tunisiensis TaxID=1096341 RepID=A0A4R7KM36_9CLOT|nr:TIGR02679 domain-containing protein [Fonticella tunisiensis]TDT57245.1 uncharacterized protein (TIGR02679 family) [Fonticella tunisiensis]
MSLEKSCIEYFKSDKGFKRLFEGIREKYRSLGSLGGTVVINNLTQDEREALSGLFKKDYYSRKSASIKVEKLVKALEDTRFSGVDFERVLMGYFGEELISKRKERDIYELEKSSFFDEILYSFQGTRSWKWLKSILESRDNAYRMILQKYDRERESLKEALILTMKALNELTFNERNATRLALFSSKISRNPHTFDMDRNCGRLLMYGISYFLGIQYPKGAEDKAEALYSAGIIADEISNYTAISGLLAYRNGKVHRGWEGFYSLGEPLQVSLWNLSEIDYILSPSGKIFVFENPTVFSEVLYSTREKRPPLVCTCGQIKLASLVLLDRIIDNVDYIYYSGDFDPEGLLIADRLKKRYGEKLVLWRYSIEDYEGIKSNEVLEEIRLKKLDNLKSPELKTLGEHIRNKGLAAYQELLTDRYIEDINKYMSG